MPKFDKVCLYGQYYFDMFDGSDDDCIKFYDWAVNKKYLDNLHNISTILVTGHGSQNYSIGSDKLPLFDLSNIELLSNKIVFFPVCLMGQDIGKRIGEIGTFVGYVDEFAWVIDKTKTPSTDYAASFFWHVQQSIARDILEGLSLFEIRNNAMFYYNLAIEAAKNSKLSKDDKEKVVNLLDYNRNNFVVYGSVQPIKQNYSFI